VKAAVAVVPNLAIDFLSEWVGDLTGVDTKSFSKLAKEYVLAMLGQETVEQAVDTSFKQLTEPAVERAATILSNGLNKRWTHAGTPENLVALEPIVRAHGERAWMAAAKSRRERETAHAEAMTRMGVTDRERRIEFRGRDRRSLGDYGPFLAEG
jgi:hypothetical protein